MFKHRFIEKISNHFNGKNGGVAAGLKSTTISTCSWAWCTPKLTVAGARTLGSLGRPENRRRPRLGGPRRGRPLEVAISLLYRLFPEDYSTTSDPPGMPQSKPVCRTKKMATGNGRLAPASSMKAADKRSANLRIQCSRTSTIVRDRMGVGHRLANVVLILALNEHLPTKNKWAPRIAAFIRRSKTFAEECLRQ